MAVVWVTHDLGVVARLVDRVVVMYAGHIVEQAPTRELFRRPQHPYTAGLLASLPNPLDPSRPPLAQIAGTPPDATRLRPVARSTLAARSRSSDCVSERAAADGSAGRIRGGLLGAARGVGE